MGPPANDFLNLNLISIITDIFSFCHQCQKAKTWIRNRLCRNKHPIKQTKPLLTRMWLGFLSLNKSQRCLLLIFWTPINIEFWWLNKSFRDRLRDEKWWYLLGNSVVDCSYYNCSSIKSSVHKRSHSRTQLRVKQQQLYNFTTITRTRLYQKIVKQN